jgi:hypothetical protein
MAGSVRAATLGEEYEHRYFWIEACGLYMRGSPTIRVAIEQPDIRAFDDVVSYHRGPVLDAYLRHIESDHYQLKFHLVHDEAIRAEDFVDPDFINATSVSLLERARDAVREGDRPVRLTLVTPWPIDSSDPLRHLVSNRDGEFDIDRLFEGGPRSDIGKIRASWRQRLGGADDQLLARVARHVRVHDNVPMWRIDRELDARLELAGLFPLDHGSPDHPYVGVSRALIAARRTSHDGCSLRPILDQAGLWRGLSGIDEGPRQIGIKSFGRQVARLEDEADVLDLLPFFHGRYALADVDWDRDLAPRVRSFLEDRITFGPRYDLHLDAHISIGFLAGYLLGKSDADVAPVQRQGRVVWRPTGATQEGPFWDVRDQRIGDGPDLALAVEVTRRVADDVARYAMRDAPEIGRVLRVTVPGEPGLTAVHGAEHAAALASHLVRIVEQHRSVDERRTPLHVFIAGPIALAYMIGHEGRAFGRTITYEFDFDTGEPGAYTPAFHLPMP